MTAVAKGAEEVARTLAGGAVESEIETAGPVGWTRTELSATV